MVELGHSMSTIVPVCEGFVNQHVITQFAVTGRDLSGRTAALVRGTRQADPPLLAGVRCPGACASRDACAAMRARAGVLGASVADDIKAQVFVALARVSCFH